MKIALIKDSEALNFFTSTLVKCIHLLVMSSIVLLFGGSLKAQVTGRGCNLGVEVATHYLGTATYYGGSLIVDIYGPEKVPIAFGNGYSGYRCNYINIYPPGVRWNPVTQSAEPYPGAQEITAISVNKCISTSSYATNYSGNGLEGTEVNYKYNDPSQFPYQDPNYACNTNANNVPIDDHLPILLLTSVGCCVYYFRNNMLSQYLKGVM